MSIVVAVILERSKPIRCEVVMRLQIAFGFFYFFLLVVITSWAYEVSQFRWVKSDDDEVHCATSRNKTLSTVTSRLHCVSSCNHQCLSLCKAVNYWTNTQLCQHFHYLPYSYEVMQDCATYRTVNKTLYM